MWRKKKISTRRHVGSFWSLWTVQDKKEESKRVGHDLNKIVQKKKKFFTSRSYFEEISRPKKSGPFWK